MDSGQNQTIRAMQEAPNYWLAWYSFKSIALVGAVAWVAYLIGKNSRRRR